MEEQEGRLTPDMEPPPRGSLMGKGRAVPVHRTQEGTPRRDTRREGTPKEGTPRLGTPMLGTPKLGTPRVGHTEAMVLSPKEDPTATRDPQVRCAPTFNWRG